MISIETCTLDEIITEGEKYYQKHWEEVESRSEHHDLEIDWEFFRELDEADALRVVVAKKAETVIGYLAIVLSLAIHNRETVEATTDVIYVAEEARGVGVAAKLLSFAEEWLEDEGVTCLNVVLRPGHDHKGLMQKAGYREDSISYMKRLGEV